MVLSEEWEKLERQRLSPYACLSGESRGRERSIEKCPIRTDFQRDRDRILHSKAFRRLKHKSQVFLDPISDHHRTRLTHTLEVSQISRTMARALRLNEDLTEAIALGHDLGHTPFGHMGERTLARLTAHVFPFRHNEQSLRVVDVLEGPGGLNLTWEVRDGILNHQGELPRATLEAELVHIADRIAYVNHDLDDALRAGLLRSEQLPPRAIRILGTTSGERINTLVLDVARHSDEKSSVAMTEEKKEALQELRQFLFNTIYQSKWATEEERKADHLLTELYYYLSQNPLALPEDNLQTSFHEGLDRAVCDYIAGMTDNYALARYRKYLLPDSFGQ